MAKKEKKEKKEKKQKKETSEKDDQSMDKVSASEPLNQSFMTATAPVDPVE